MTLVSALTGAGILLCVSFLTFFEIGIPLAVADNVTTSVTVLNTPPQWTVNAQESVASATTTPTNSGATITFVATATDSNAENYYLIICKTTVAPTAVSSAPPTCNGGISNRWAISGATASGAQASASTSTIETFPFQNESNDWYGWVCDANASLPRCNQVYTNTTGDLARASPFVVNHPPVFAGITNDGPANPGETVTWTSTSYDTDTLDTNDTVRLLVCRSADFSTSTGACGAGGTWATSTLAATNAATTTTIQIPTQDRNYDAYVYIVDTHGHAATSTLYQASSSVFAVNNVAPSVTAASISLEDTDNIGNITLTVPSATSGPFFVKFEVVDNNSCLNASSGNEFSSARANVYRSGVASTSCYLASGHYNSNNCYPNASPFFSNFISCTQDVGTCSGAGDSSAEWTCRFSLWYNADPTVAATPWTAQNWLATVEAFDDNTATSSFIEAVSGNEVGTFMAFNVTETAIGYGGLEPGQFNDPLASTTDLIALGNVGLDEDLYGDTMCTTWSAPDSCDTNGFQITGDIPVANQKFATSSAGYNDPDAYVLAGSSTPTDLLIRVPKTTATSTPSELDTYWGINIPSDITLAGDYSGQNTITAKVSNFLFW